MKKGKSIIIILIVVIAGGVLFFVTSLQQSTNDQIGAALSEKSCEISKKPFEFNAEIRSRDPSPDTYVVKVSIETTSIWTNVEVKGIQSITTAGFVQHLESDSTKNISVDGLNVNELARPETDAAVLPPISTEYDAIVQKKGDTAEFRINKEQSGTTTYKLYSVIGNSIEEIAQFIHDGGDTIRTFSLDLSLLSTPLVLPSVEERYNGPLFDAHLHLTGQDSESSPDGIEYTKLLVNPDNANAFFTMLDTQGVIGFIGFFPINHDYFVSSQEWNEPFLKQTEAVLNHCDKLIPFLFPDSLLGIISRDFFEIELIDQYINNYPIPFRGIGEIHVDGENPLYADIRLNDDLMFDLYDYAAENNLVMMIHPRESDLEDLHDALNHNPKTIILIHGDEGIEKIIPPLLQEHDNLYYSIDAGLMYPYSLPISGMTKKKFLKNLDSNGLYYRVIASALQYWKPLIEAYPERILWGTDALWSWHFDDDVYSEVTWFARDFIGGLSPEVQEKFGYKNAERMLLGR